MNKKRISITLGSLLGILVILFLFIHLYPAMPAQAADSILRPVIGEKSTLALESWYFNISDEINRVTYTYRKPNAAIFTPPTNTGKITVNADKLNLTAIPIFNNFIPLTNEGKWQPIFDSAYPFDTVMAKTFIRPDPARPYAVVSLVKMDMKKLNIGVQAGTYYPGGVYKIYGPGIVPKDVQQSNTLVAVFNGGFMARDGHYGMIVAGKTYVPLRKDLATLLIYANGSAQLVDYTGQKFGSNVEAIRQNGAFLVRNGAVTSFVEHSSDTWGRTTTNSMYTWRSGIGITKNGNIIYAVGNSLIPQTLASALQKAGAVNAMQLDINPYWVRFILYNSLGNGRYSYYPLLTNMANGGYAYLHGYNKDFFYVYNKNTKV